MSLKKPIVCFSLVLLQSILSCHGLASDAPINQDFTNDDLEPYQVDNSYCSVNSSDCKTQPPDDSSIRLDHRTDNSWRWNYIDEEETGYNWLITDESFDARLSNVLYTISGPMAATIDMHKYNLGDAEFNRELERKASGSVVNNELCSVQLKQMLSLMDEMSLIVDAKRKGQHNSSSLSVSQMEERHVRLARVLDSFGRYESGALAGRHHFLGSYTQCLGTQMTLDKSEPAKKTTTRYCVAKLSTHKHLDSSLRARKKPQHENDLGISTGICIPESCHTQSFYQHKQLFQTLVDSQFKLPRSIFIDEALELESVFCSPDNDSELGSLSLGAKLFIATMAIWFGVLTYATYKSESLAKNSKISPSLSYYYDCLSLKSSWFDFVGENNKNRAGRTERVELNTLNPVKVLGCAFVTLGHSFALDTSFSMNGLRYYSELEINPKLSLIAFSTFMTDTFFTITGMMLTYLTLKKLDSVQRSSNKCDKSTPPPPSQQTSLLRNISRYFSALVVGRYLRLLPLYFVVYWFCKTMMSHVGSGPIWDYGFNKSNFFGGCKLESWWIPITFSAAHLPLTQQCLAQAWSVSNDMFFTVLLAPLILMMRKTPRLAIVCSLLSCFVCVRVFMSQLSTIDPGVIEGFSEVRAFALSLFFNQSSLIFASPYHRIFSVIVGASAGYMLYNYSKQSNKQWPKWLTGTATVLSFALLASIVISVVMFSVLRRGILKTYPIHRYVLPHMSSSGRILWAMSNAIIFLRMMTDWKDNFFMRNSAGQFWQSMANLNYAILFNHVLFIIYNKLSALSIRYFSAYDVLCLFASSYLLSCLAAVPMYLLIENPIDKLIKSLVFGAGEAKILQRKRLLSDVREESAAPIKQL